MTMQTNNKPLFRRPLRGGGRLMPGYIALLLFAVGCKGSQEIATTATEKVETPAMAASALNAGHDNLNALLWMQTSAEYRALTKQAYLAAQLALDDALTDPQWTASLEQEAAGNYSALPPAIVLDVDETVLDNSPYQAGLVANNGEYTADSWAAWTAQAAAEAIPGALAFTQEAAARDVTVVYLTNRRANEEHATRQNLARLGFPVDTTSDVVLTRGEQTDWDTSDKTTRRAALAKRFRILMLVGDNLGDFIEVPGDVATRAASVDSFDEYWGLRWIVLPNPSYGNWETGLFDNDFSQSSEQRRARKRSVLRGE